MGLAEDDANVVIIVESIADNLVFVYVESFRCLNAEDGNGSGDFTMRRRFGAITADTKNEKRKETY